MMSKNLMRIETVFLSTLLLVKSEEINKGIKETYFTTIFAKNFGKFTCY